MNVAFSIEEYQTLPEVFSFQKESYSIVLLEGEGKYSVDFVEYNLLGQNIIFFSPFQNIIISGMFSNVKLVNFKAEFYCIEHHKHDVACNGLLFNNIYLAPHITVDNHIFSEIFYIAKRMQEEDLNTNSYSSSIVQTYLQLILALASKYKKHQIVEREIDKLSSEFLKFQQLLEENYKTIQSVSFYANKLALSPDAFSKKIKQQVNKTPKQLIQERVILEAKRLLHLTDKTIKEIAWELSFEDEFYFSRYFKKNVGIPPLRYREDTAI